MEPISIAFKDFSINPFTGRGSGELMVVHLCLSCGKISPNRIAGDDSEYQILAILTAGLNTEKAILTRMTNMGLTPINKSNIKDAYISLLGENYKKYLKRG